MPKNRFYTLIRPFTWMSFDTKMAQKLFWPWPILDVGVACIQSWNFSLQKVLISYSNTNFTKKTPTLMSPTLLQNCSPILTEYFDRKWIYQKFWLKSKDFDSVLVTRISMHFLTDYYDEKLIHQRFWWKSEDFDGHHDELSSHQNAVRHKFWQVFGLSKSIIHSLWRISRKVNLDQRFFESNKFRHKFCHRDHFPSKSTEIFVKKSIKIWPVFVVWSNSFLI